ncbi:MAG: hypothetical protein U1F11_15290 [Steroidobacteraceae bacterium]
MAATCGGRICRLRHPAPGPARPNPGWQLVDGRGSVFAARLVTCLPVGAAGWWLGFRARGRRRWLWVEARTVAPAEYRRLCRLLREAHGEGRPVDGA